MKDECPPMARRLGRLGLSFLKCPKCGGKGYREVGFEADPRFTTSRRPIVGTCPDCGGRGTLQREGGDSVAVR